MATCHLITDAQFTLHGDIHFGHLYNAAGKVITHGQGKLITGEATVNLTVLNIVVVQQILNQVVGILVRSPFVGTYLGIVNCLQGLRGELHLLRDQLFLVVGIDSVGGLTGKDNQQTVDQLLFQLCQLVVILLFRLGEQLFLLGTLLAVTNYTGKEFLVDHDTTHRWGHLQ